MKKIFTISVLFIVIAQARMNITNCPHLIMNGIYRSLRISCEKCYRECGGDNPTLFPDPYCRRCIPSCY